MDRHLQIHKTTFLILLSPADSLFSHIDILNDDPGKRWKNRYNSSSLPFILAGNDGDNVIFLNP